MANGNKSLGRFKLSGIPPAPRGIPQVQVAFDIDANGILQVTAMDRTTGREQGITIQGASTLSEEEVQRMMREAEEYAEVDRQKKEKVEKRNDAESLILKAERQMRENTLDYGMQFVRPYRNRIEPAIASIKEALAKNDERAIDRSKADLEDALQDLNREVYQRNQEEKEKDSFFGAIKSFFTDDDDYYDYRDAPRDDYFGNRYGSGGYGSGGYGGYGSGGYGSSYGSSRRDSYPSSDRPERGDSGWDSRERDNRNRDSYSRDSYGRDNYSRDNYSRDAYSDRRPDSSNPSDRRGNDWGTAARRQDDWGDDDQYRDRDQYTNGRNADPIDRNERSRSSGSQSGRDPYPSATNRRDTYADDRSERNRSPRRKPDKPDLYRDNWDDEDDWL
jgi:molecular chaperone DnaK